MAQTGILNATMFGEQYLRLRRERIEYDGEIVYAVYRRVCNGPVELRVRRLVAANGSADGVTTQGVNIETRGARLSAAGSSGQGIVMWSDTAPDLVTLVSEGHVNELKIWNSYRTEAGTVEAWIGNAGMLITERGRNILRFACNSRPKITFEDLIFEIEFIQR